MKAVFLDGGSLWSSVSIYALIDGEDAESASYSSSIPSIPLEKFFKLSKHRWQLFLQELMRFYQVLHRVRVLAVFGHSKVDVRLGQDYDNTAEAAAQQMATIKRHWTIPNLVLSAQ